ncbi:MAG TPA: DoxX family protein [Burkholderiales bacterium]|nr:DoxX family protein [Burkholderiales bacterium]
MEITANAIRQSPIKDGIAGVASRALAALDHYAVPLLDLAIRLYVGSVFFLSGLTKIQSWDTTLALFENEYSVPLLPPQVAAYLGTFTELFMPVLLVLGLGGRLSALVLFVFNIVAAISYPDLSPAGLVQHQMWGALLLVTLLHGPGKLSIDHAIRRRFGLSH